MTLALIVSVVVVVVLVVVSAIGFVIDRHASKIER
jgi:hypothetical protein